MQDLNTMISNPMKCQPLKFKSQTQKESFVMLDCLLRLFSIVPMLFSLITT